MYCLKHPDYFCQKTKYADFLLILNFLNKNFKGFRVLCILFLISKKKITILCDMLQKFTGTALIQLSTVKSH